LSSTTRSREQGQVLVLFAGGALVLFIVAALAFDTGMILVQRRDEQNAADAAALAGARYVITSQARAIAAARDIARQNGFDDTDPTQVVDVHIPPIHGLYAGLGGFIEVDIQDTRESIFGGVIGRGTWPVSASAVATNAQNLTFPLQRDQSDWRRRRAGIRQHPVKFEWDRGRVRRHGLQPHRRRDDRC
jgi:hypothetical protein